jgi:hypothetical protein
MNINVPASKIAEDLKAFVDKHDSQKAAAKALRVTDSQLSMALSGKSRVIPGKILKKLGYVAALAYFAIGNEPKTKAAKKPPTAKKSPAKKTAPKKAKKVASRKVGMPAALGAGFKADATPVQGDSYKAVAAEAFRNAEASTSPNPVIEVNLRGE